MRFEHHSPDVRTVLTYDAGATIRSEMLEASLSRALIICSSRQSCTPAFRRIVTQLGDNHCGTFTETDQHPTRDMAERCATAALRASADCIIALGGGSTSDLAKATALWLEERGTTVPVSSSRVGARRPFRDLSVPLIPLIAIPTTASGAELTSSFTQKQPSGIKLPFRDDRLYSKLIVLDPTVAASTPILTMASTCMNAIAHCVEALYSTETDPFSSNSAVRGFAILYQSLSAAAQGGDSVSLREAMLIGANFAGQAIVNARTALHHAACHVLGAAGIPHGIANSIMLPHSIRFNSAAAGETLAPLYALVGCPANGIDDALAAAITKLSQELSLPQRLREMGLERERLGPMPRQILNEPGPRFNPRQSLTEFEVAAFLAKAW